MPIEDKFERNIKLAPFTTFKIGGPADFFVEAYTASEIIESINWAKQNGKPYFILGGGSNILVNDAGYRGLVIKNVGRDLKIENDIITCDSGVPLSKIVQLATNHDMTGMEWAVGVPGSVGGAVRGNAACFGSEMAAVVIEAEAYDTETGSIVHFSHEQCEFCYRSSIFKKRNLVLLSCKIQLPQADTLKIRQRMQEVIKKRIEQQPKYPSAGSVFKNISLSEASPELIRDAEQEGKIAGAGPGGVASAWLIERLYLKGKWIGGAMISDEHANFIVNRDFSATAEDVVMLISFIKQQVRANYNVMLKEEILYVGF